MQVADEAVRAVEVSSGKPLSLSLCHSVSVSHTHSILLLQAVSRFLQTTLSSCCAKLGREELR